MAASKLPVNSLAPVRKRFPILAPEKSNLLVGLRRFRISRLMELRMLRMSSFLGDEMPDHRE